MVQDHITIPIKDKETIVRHLELAAAYILGTKVRIEGDECSIDRCIIDSLLNNLEESRSMLEIAHQFEFGKHMDKAFGIAQEKGE